MKKGCRLSVQALAVLTAAGLVVGCGGSGTVQNQTHTPTQSSQKPVSDTFSLYWNDGSSGFDPGLWTFQMFLDSAGIFEGLVHGGPNGGYELGVADKIDHNSDYTVWTFHLRKDAKFSNGDPVTADDFVYSIRRAVSLKTSQETKHGPVPITDVPIANIVQCRTGQKPMSALGVKALDAHTLQMTLSHKDEHLLRDMTLNTSAWIVPVDKRVVENMKPDDWSDPSKVVGNGPYKLASFKNKTSATLVPNPYYWGKVSLKKITVQFSPNINQLLAFKNGTLDCALLSPQDVAAVNADPTLKNQLHYWNTQAQYTLEVMPSKNKALQNEDVRKAFEMAIDKEAICKSVLNGTAIPAYDPFLMQWQEPWVKDTGISYNPEKAKQLLAKAGYPGGKGFPTVVLLVGSTTDHVAEAIQQMWQQTLGVKVVFKGEEWGQYLTDMKKQLPANEVGWVNNSQQGSYPELKLPQDLGDWLFSNNGLHSQFLPPNIYQQWYQIDSNTSLDPTKKESEEVALYEKYLPKDYIDYVKTGVKAYQTQDENLLKKFYITREQRAYDIPVYTPKNPVLLRSSFTGYTPNNFILTNPPYWFNDIHAVGGAK
ncbi:MAG: peptide ABC transporter substrate-binding protein [Alicyclobacillus herbarius]|uniref:peptide ABC transporter substrate-binding protein n=1 Tax=Alicyclobacillus herbarius TaxID=122960 RepID=UPI0023520176|nr:peptide ABC transporter substrate-binding protein [Alicyclobacillus herbarius]MCL6632157.1 peptide ABC transporter substrate-binding protein [Alicyclobacillus herbarius]